MLSEEEARAPAERGPAGRQRLDRWLHRRALSLDVFLELAIGLAEGLDRLHTRKLLHRHLHPGNVLVDEDGVPALLDPQGAELGADELAYMAPEQTGRMDRVADERADLYSLGAIYHRLLTGAPPFAGTDPIDLVHAHLARPPTAPEQLNPLVPPVLSQLVLRLLAKMPEQRYQSAQTLLTDLYHARARLRHDGTITPFELGRADLVSELPLPATLFGREGELQALQASWATVAAGGSRIVLLAGAAGAGKSRLARALETQVTAEGQGRSLSGTFPRRQNASPYAPVVEALSGLLRRLLAEPEPVRAAWARGVRLALGRNAAVITGLIPELARLIGQPRPVRALDPSGNRNRFQQAFLAFMRALLEQQPLLLFLDDLQWADAESLRLVQTLASAPDLSRLLLLGAYRSEGVEPEHPLLATIGALRDGEARLTILALPPLEVASIAELCAAALDAAPDRVYPLAQVLRRKTAGNPFFVEQLLRFLQKTGLLRRVSDRDGWDWELAEVERVNVTDNVADLLIAALHHVPQPVRAVLGAAASIGRTIPLSWLAVASGQRPEEIAAAVRSAISEGYLVGLPGEANGLDPDEQQRFQFAHDWLQQACLPLLAASEQRRLHLALGRHLLSSDLEEGPADDLLLAGLAHLDLVHDDLGTPEERLRVCRLNGRAARLARATSAYAQALAHLQRAIALLPADPWMYERPLTFSLYRDALECALVCDARPLADTLFRTALEGLPRPRDASDLYRIRSDAAMTGGAMAEAIEWARRGLQILGLDLPAAEAAAAGAEELQTARANLARVTFEEIASRPALTDPEVASAMVLLRGLLAPTYVTGSALFPFVLGRLLNLSLAGGPSASSATAYAFHAMVLACQSGETAAGHRFGELALALADRFGDPVERLGASAAFLHNLAPWRTPLRAIVPRLYQVQAQGLESGDIHHAMACAGGAAMILFHQGVELHRVVPALEAVMASSRHAHVLGNATTLAIYRQHAARLQGLGREPPSVPGVDSTGETITLPAASLQEAAFVRQLTPQQLGTYHSLRLQLCYLLGDLTGASAASAAARPLLTQPRLSVLLSEQVFYTALCLAAGDAGPPVAALADLVERLRVWAEDCPENFRHKHLLLAAELARIEGRTLDAQRGYDEAIQAAAREQFLQDEALAHELAARFHRADGRRRFAGLYLRGARELYRKWGAAAKVEALQEEFPEEDSDPAPADGRRPGPEAHLPAEVSLDVNTLVRAAEAISQEVALARVLDKLMEVCLATTGAERGAVLLVEEEGLVLRARRSLSEATSLHREPLARTGHLPRMMVEKVEESGEVLVLADASAHVVFGQDPHVRAQRVRSALVLPIFRQGRLTGVLYLENNLATRVFKPERVRLLQLLSSQIAGALENGRLFERLAREEQALRFLAEASAALGESLDYQRAPRRVAELAVSWLADACTVYLVEGEEVRGMASASADPTRQPGLDQMNRRLTENGLPPFVRQVLRSGAPIFLPEVGRDDLAHYAQDEQVIQLLEAMGMRSAMVLPLSARGRIVGVISLVATDPSRRWNDGDLAVATELARRAAAAIDNARLYHQKEEAVRLRDEFLSIASHELRTPIASLRLMTDMIGASGSGRPGSSEPEPAEAALTGPELTRAVALIGRQARRLQTLVGDLLDVEQIRTGALRIHLEPVELVEVAQNAVRTYRLEAERAGCQVEVAAAAPVVGRWDRLRLEQVLANLLSNAFKFAPGAPVEIAVSALPGAARLVVSDRGIGIPAERLPHLFRRFERAVPADNYGGLGLGLYIVKSIVESLRGEVSVESVPQRSTRFIVTLPLDPHAGVLTGA